MCVLNFYDLHTPSYHGKLSHRFIVQMCFPYRKAPDRPSAGEEGGGNKALFKQTQLTLALSGSLPLGRAEWLPYGCLILARKQWGQLHSMHTNHTQAPLKHRCALHCSKTLKKRKGAKEEVIFWWCSNGGSVQRLRGMYPLPGMQPCWRDSESLWNAAKALNFSRVTHHPRYLHLIDFLFIREAIKKPKVFIGWNQMDWQLMRLTEPGSYPLLGDEW